MKTYIVRYEITGEAEFTAETAEEAQAMFDNMSVCLLGEEGELFADPPKTREQLDAEIRECRTADEMADIEF